MKTLILILLSLTSCINTSEKKYTRSTATDKIQQSVSVKIIFEVNHLRTVISINKSILNRVKNLSSGYISKQFFEDSVYAFIKTEVNQLNLDSSLQIELLRISTNLYFTSHDTTKQEIRVFSECSLFDEHCEFYVFDIDKDGYKDLLIYSPEASGNTNKMFYTYLFNNSCECFNQLNLDFFNGYAFGGFDRLDSLMFTYWNYGGTKTVEFKNKIIGKKLIPVFKKETNIKVGEGSVSVFKRTHRQWKLLFSGFNDEFIEWNERNKIFNY